MRYPRLTPVIIGLASAGAVFWTATVPAAAHELQQDQGVSAVLHISPDDNPRSVEDTYLNFDFTSKRSGFDLRYCGCKVSLQTSPDQLLSTSITSDSSATSGYAVVNFPKAGVYDINVNGMVATQASDRFQLTYRVRVTAQPGLASAAASSAQSWQIIMLSLTSLVLVGVIAAEMMRRGGRYTPRK